MASSYTATTTSGTITITSTDAADLYFVGTKSVADFSIAETDFSIERGAEGQLTISINGATIEIAAAALANRRYTLHYGDPDAQPVLLGSLIAASSFEGSSSFNDFVVGNGGGNESSTYGKDDILFGLGGADRLSGGNGDDYIYAGGGNDVEVIGGNGNDHLYGGAGNDTLDGGSGNDHLYGGTGTNTLNGSDGDDVLHGGVGDDIFKGGNGFDTINYEDSPEGSDSMGVLDGSGVQVDLDSNYFAGGHAEGDRLKSSFDRDIERIVGSAFDDILTGHREDNTLVGGAGDDILQGLAGADTFDGGEGSDTLSYEASNAGVFVNLSIGNVLENFIGGHAAGDKFADGAETSFENLIGSGYDDTLIGNAGNNILTGGGGVDTLNGAGNAGNGNTDTLEGGEGIDNYVLAIDGHYTIRGDVDGGNLLFKGITNEAHIVATQDANDKTIVTITAGGVSVKIEDYVDGVFTIYYDADDKVRNTLVFETNTEGTAGNDTLTGDGEDDILEGMGGSDSITGAGGNDQLYGGAEDDQLYGGPGADTLVGGTGNDTLDGGDNAAIDDAIEDKEDTYIFNKGDGHDTIQGDPDSGRLIFNDATGIGNFGFSRDGDNNVVITTNIEGVVDTVKIAPSAYGHGRYTILYKDGNDNEVVLGKLYVGRSDDSSALNREIIVGSAEDDLIYGLRGRGDLTGGEGNDRLVGGEENDLLTGGAGNDFLDGGSGSDTLTGGEGDDFLDGGFGSDTLIGGEGNDILVGGRAGQIGQTDTDTYIFEGNFGDDTIQGGGVRLARLYFKDATGLDDLTISRAGNGNVTISSEDGSVTIRADSYIDDRYGIYYGSGDTLLGNLILPRLGDIFDNDLHASGRANILYGGAGIDTVTYENSGGGVTVSLVAGATNTGGDAAGDTFVSIENIKGSKYADTITGNAQANTLSGGQEADILVGGRGNDKLEGETGADSYIFGDDYGDDTIQNDADGGNLYFKSAGGVGDFDFGYVAGNLKITTNEGSVTFNSQDSARFDGVSANLFNIHYYDADDDTDKELGRLSLAEATGGLLEAADNEDKADLMIGSAVADTLKGLAGNDYLFGNAGNDVLEGGAGADRLVGGAGSDTASYENSGEGANGAGVEVSLLEGATHKGEHAVGDTLDGIENLRGSAYKDTLTGDNKENTLEGGEGNDILDGGAGSDFLEGGAGADTYVFTGGYGNDTIQNDEDGGKLYFKDARAIGDFTFSREANGDVVITPSSGGSVKILNSFYQGGRYSISYDDDTGNEVTLGKLYFGTDGDDTLAGSDGVADLLFGGEGNDSLQGGTGADLLIGGEGNDSLQGGTGEDTYIFEGNYGADIIQNDDDGGNLYFRSVENAADFVFTLDGANYVINTATNKVTVEGAGNYTIHYGAEDTILGRVLLVKNPGEDTSATDEVDLIYGSAGNDTLRGLAGNDDIRGGAGNDILEGGLGADRLDGGEGSDTATYANANVGANGAGVEVSLVENAEHIGEHAVGDTFISIENLRGSAYRDTLTGNAGDNTLEGGAGDDILDGGAGVDTLKGQAGADTLTGGEGNDFLEGGAGADTYVFTGGYGDDTIRDDADGGALQFKSALRADDLEFSRDSEDNALITGGGGTVKILNYIAGAYSISYGEGNERLGKLYLGLKDAATDTLVGSNGGDLLYGFDGNDILTGGRGDDKLYGGTGEDTYVFEALHGTDTIIGDKDEGKLYFKAATSGSSFSFSREGEDVTITLGADSVTIQGFANSQYSLHYGDADTPLGRLSLALLEGGTLRGTVDGEFLYGLAGGESIFGEGGDDTIYGGAGDDVLVGGAGEDKLYGGAGDDTLEGGAGADTLDGGAGEDSYIFANTYDDANTLVETYGADTILGDENDAAGTVNKLYFRDATGLGDFSFSRTADKVDITIGTDVTSIASSSYADGRYSLHYGADDLLLGRLWIATAGATTTASVGDVQDLMVGTAGTDTLQGLDGNDILQGLEGTDTLEGGAGDDILYGGAGVDTLEGGAGNDILEGGEDADNYVFTGDYGNDIIQNDENGGNLQFKTALKADDIEFSRNDDGDVIARVGDNSVRILPSAQGTAGTAATYNVAHGSDTALGTLLIAAGEGAATIETAVATLGDANKNVMVGTIGSDILQGLAENDRLYGAGGSDVLDGGAGDDTLTGGAGNDTLKGGEGADTYIFAGDYGADTIEGEDEKGGTLYFKDATGIEDFDFRRDDGNIKITGGGGSVTIKAESYAAGKYNIFYGENNDALGGLLFATNTAGDTLTGGGGDDLLYGLAGADTLLGGEGDDTLYGGEGNDILKGGGGAADSYIFADKFDDDTIQEDADGGNLLFKNARDFDALGFERVGESNENVEITLGGDSVTIENYANGLFNIHYGAEDTALGRLSLALATGGPLVAKGGVADEGLDLMLGSAVVDTLEGNGGADRLYGYAGADILKGGAGDDFLYGGNDGDTLEGGAGADNIYGGADADTLVGGADADMLDGGEGEDTLVGGAGADILDGGEGVDTASYADSADGVVVNMARDLAFGGDARDDTFISIENLRGSAHKDTLIGNGGANTLEGGAGNDMLDGGAGVDTLEGEAGIDMLIGGAGNDFLDGGNGNDFLYGGAGVDTLKGGDGDLGVDMLYGGSNNDFLDGGGGKDIYVFEGRYGADTVQGDTDGGTLRFASAEGFGDLGFSTDADGNVLIEGGGGSVKILADIYENGRFSVSVGAGSIALGLSIGTIGDDNNADENHENAFVKGTINADLLYGLAGIDTLRGLAGDDTLYGGEGGDTLEGGVGDDTLDGGEGNDYLKGGEGTDNYIFAGGFGEDTIQEDADGGNLLFKNAGDLDAIGFERVDENNVKITLGGDSVTIQNYVDGRFSIYYGAEDTALGRFSLAATADRGGTVAARDDEVSDLMLGLEGADVFDGKEGNDNLYGYKGEDILTGSEGADNLYGGDDNDMLYGGEGVDNLYGGADADTLEGGAGADILDGGEGEDTASYAGSTDGVVVNMARDLAFGGDARDDTFISIENIRGSAHKDTLIGNGGANTLEGGAGHDMLDGGAGVDTLEGEAGIDMLIGGAGNDFLDGGNGNDFLYGGAGVDTLKGGDGDLGVDMLYGGSNNDFLDGGGGKDIYVFEGRYGADTVQGDADGGTLRFASAEGFGDLGFSADADDNVLIAGGGGSVKIMADIYDNGRFNISIGAGSIALGLSIGTTGDDKEDDAVSGDEKADLLYGLAGEDTLTGGAGDDTLDGGLDNDILQGGTGTDSYIFAGRFGEDIIQGDEDDGNLLFKNARNVDALDVERVGENNENVKITLGGDAVTIESYAHGRFNIHYGSEDKVLGRLFLAVEAGERLAAKDGAGSDFMLGSAGVDTLEAKGGVDRLYGYAGDDILRGGTGNDFLYGGDDNDILEGGAGADRLEGGKGTDTASYENSLSTDAFNQIGVTVGLEAGAGDTATGDARGDTFFGIENLRGSNYKDTLTGNRGANTLEGRAGDDRLYGGAGNDTLYGGEQKDTLDGGSGDDTLYGGADDDTLDGGLNNDDLDGGAGRDTYVFAGRYGTDTIISDADGGNLQFKNAVDIGSFRFSKDDSGTVSIVGGGGTLKILNTAYADGRYTIQYGNNNIGVGRLALGTNGDDNNPVAGQDDSLVSGTGGADLMYGLAGEDTLTGDAGDDTLDGGLGNDILQGGTGTDSYVFVGRFGEDTIQGDADDGNLLFKNARNFDALDFDRVGENNENVKITLGRDFVTIEDYAHGRFNIHYGTKDTLLGRLSLAEEAGGKIEARGGEVSDLMIGLAGVDTLEGKGGVDRLYGYAGDDTLQGGTGDDFLYGGDDNDILEGGVGADRLEGGNGADTASYENSAEGTDGAGVEVSLAAGYKHTGEHAVGDILVGIENLIGSSYKDTLTGNGAANTLEGGAGADTLNGGGGIDTASYASSKDATTDEIGVVVSLVADAENTGEHAQGDILISIENLIGSDFRDRLTGNGAANRLDGGAHNDILDGGGGNDVLVGGDGADTLTGGAGNDFLEGGAGADIYIFEGSYGTDTIRDDADGGKLYFNDANDISDLSFSLNRAGTVSIAGGGGSVKIIKIADVAAVASYNISYDAGATEPDKLLVGSESADTLIGGAGADRLYAYEGADILQGGAGEDFLYGGNDDDTLEGGAGVDNLYGGNDDDTLEGGAGADRLDGGAGADTASYASSTAGVEISLVAGATYTGLHAVGDTLISIENLRGSAFGDTLTGNGAANTLEGGAGADSLYGGAGIDTASYASSTVGANEAGVEVSLAVGAEHKGVHAAGDTLVSIENLIGSAFKDTLTGDGAANRLDGGAHDDILVGEGGNDVLVGGDGADTLTGGAGNDFLEGGAGADTYVFAGSYGTDTIRDDADGGKLYFNDANDISDLSFSLDRTGNVSIEAGGGSVKIIKIADAVASYSISYDAGATEPDKLLVGSESADTLTSGAGVDRLYGYAGADILQGGAGDDLLYGGNDGDTLEGGAGVDNLYGGDDDDTLEGGAGADRLDGGKGIDTASYASSTDVAGVEVSLVAGATYTGEHALGDTLVSIENLRGSAFGDRLTGDGKANTLEGGAGADRLDGGAGTDTYVFSVGDDADTIVDVAGNTMTLRFDGASYAEADFAGTLEEPGNFARVNDDLVISLDKDGSEDKITIENAYDSNARTGTGNSAFTINIEYGSDGSFTEVANEFWHLLVSA